MNIRDAVKRIVHDEFAENYGVPCTVDEGSLNLEEGTCTCSPINGDAKFKGVRLQAHPGNGVLMVPKEGSHVIVQPINEMTGYISMFSAIDSIQLMDGSYGGLIKIDELVDKMNNLEDQVNSLLSSLQGVVVPLAPSGTYPFAPLFTQTPLTPTQVEELENDKITHGDI